LLTQRSRKSNDGQRNREKEKLQVSNAGKMLARGRRSHNWLLIVVILLGLIIIGQGIFYAIESKTKDKITLIDPATGTVILTSIVDPIESNELLDQVSSWTAQTILDRNPAGLDDENLVPILFDQDTQKKVREEFAKLLPSYREKGLRAHIEIESVVPQTIREQGRTDILSTVVCQDVITGHDASGELRQEVKQVTLVLKFAANPYLNHAKHYPLMCIGYEESGETGLAKK
jgi:hypothetical protein